MTATTKRISDLPGYNFQEELNIFVSARIKLTDAQRLKLKHTFNEQREQLSITNAPKIGGSQITASTAVAHPLQAKFPSILLSDLLGSRESLPILTILQIQSALSVEVVSKAEVLEACSGYVDYVFAKAANG